MCPVFDRRLVFRFQPALTVESAKSNADLSRVLRERKVDSSVFQRIWNYFLPKTKFAVDEVFTPNRPAIHTYVERRNVDELLVVERRVIPQAQRQLIPHPFSSDSSSSSHLL